MSEMSPESTAKELADYINSLSLRFMDLRQQRHAVGAEEYGPLTFLQNDVVRMMIEELADTANYCEMQAIKLLILQERLEELGVTQGLVTDDGDVEIGFKAFKGTKDVGWHK